MYTWGCLGQLQGEQISTPASWNLKVYVEFSHVYHSDGFSLTLLSQGCILENGSSCGNGGYNLNSEDKGAGEEPPTAWVHLVGQSVVIFFPWSPSILPFVSNVFLGPGSVIRASCPFLNCSLWCKILTLFSFQSYAHSELQVWSSTPPLPKWAHRLRAGESEILGKTCAVSRRRAKLHWVSKKSRCHLEVNNNSVKSFR